MNTMKETEFRNYKPGDCFYCKDRRILLYLGKNKQGYKLFAWIDCMMAGEGYSEVSYINKDYILKRLEQSIEYLVSTKKLPIVDYKGLPNILDFVCSIYNNKYVNALIEKYNVAVQQVKRGVTLKRGYLYRKCNKDYSEIYLYLGYQSVQICTSMYAVNREPRKVHLYLFIGSSVEGEDTTEEGLLRNLNNSLRCGYDGIFSINFKKTELQEIKQGIRENKIPFNTNTLLRL